jgi:hypothetical protein
MNLLGLTREMRRFLAVCDPGLFAATRAGLESGGFPLFCNVKKA